MKIILLIILAIILLVIYILISKLTIKIHYYHGDDNDQLKVTVKALFGLISKKIDVPVIKLKKDSPEVVVEEKSSNSADSERKKTTLISFEDFFTSMKDTKKIIQHIKDGNHIIKHFLKRMIVRKFIWHSAIGTRDAALTGKINGAAWGVKGFAQMMLYKYFSVRCKPIYSITPHFNRTLSVTDFHCIITIRIGYAILTAIKLIRHWKGGKVHLPASPFSKNNNKANNESL